MNIKYIFILILGVSLTSCGDDFLNLQPYGPISEEQLSDSPRALEASLNGIYNLLGNSGSPQENGGTMCLKLGMDAMSNDLALSKRGYFYTFADFTVGEADHPTTLYIWYRYYNALYSCNLLIYRLEKNPNSKTDEKLKSILGQAKALRAFCYTNLTHFYTFTYVGHEDELCIPFSNPESPGNPNARSTVKEVYQFIVKDYTEAINLLKDFKRSNKNAINADAAKALLSNIYLEMGKYDLAAQYAGEVKSLFPLMNEEEYTQGGFSSIESTESIWGVARPLGNDLGLRSFFSHMDPTAKGHAHLLEEYKLIDKRLYNQIKDTDYRKKNFNGADPATYSFKGRNQDKVYPAYVSFKFKDPTDNFTSDETYLRASLLYYIEAEGLARSGNEAKAQQVLFDITSKRDPSYTKSVQTGQGLIDEILLQKRIEMWGEGYAWLDMKRHKIDLVRQYEGSNHLNELQNNVKHDDPKNRFKIPLEEVRRNPNIPTGA